MARSKKDVPESDIDSDIDSDYQDDVEVEDLDYGKPLPPTMEDAFNKIDGTTTMPTRIRKKPQPYGSTPSPTAPTLKKKSKKKIAPLVNSNRTNQSNNSKTKKRPRVKAKASTKLPSSVEPLSSIATNVQPNAILLNEVSLSTSVPNGALLS